MNITRFMSNMDNMSRQNQFEVEIRCPNIGLYMRAIRCKNAAMPGKSFETALFTEVASGANRPYITKVIYSQDVTLTFICDSTFEDKQKIELWQQYMYNDDYSLRYPLEPATGYVGEVVIKQLDRGGNVTYEVTLHEAFPQILAAQTLDMESSAIQTFDVTFGYRTWSSAFENSPGGTILGNLFKKYHRKLKNRVRREIEEALEKPIRKITNIGRNIDKII